MPGAYIMNLGEMLQRSTSGYLKATPHRVISPAGGERISVAFFFNPRFETVFEAIELPPFAAAIRAGVAAIMTTHVVFEAIDPGVPATMSPAAIDGLLRETMGYRGVVISDDLEMAAIAGLVETGEAAVRTVEAGVDLLLCCHRPDRQHRAIDALADAVRGGRIAERRIDDSLERLDRLFAAYVRPPHPTDSNSSHH